MEKLTAQHPHILRRFLEDMLENPIAVDWSQEPRLGWPRVEIFVNGATYLPARTDPETVKSKNPRSLPPDELWASPAQLRELYAGGKIDLAHPFADVGRVAGSGEPAFKPWPEPGGNPNPKEPGTFDQVLVWARLLKHVQLCSGIRIRPNEIFVSNYATLYPMTVCQPATVEILRR